MVDRQFDPALATLRRSSREDQLPGLEGEIDPLRLFAGHDRRLTDRREEWPGDEIHADRIGPGGEDVAPAGETPLDKPRGNRRRSAPEEDLAGADRDLHRHVGAAQAAFHQLHRPRRDDRRGLRRSSAGGDGRPLHLGEPAAVGADRRHLLVTQFDEDSPEGIAARLVVGGEYRPSDELTDQRRRELMAGVGREAGDGGKLERVFSRQAELAPRRLDNRGGAVGMNVENRAGWAFTDDRRQPSTGEEHCPGR